MPTNWGSQIRFLFDRRRQELNRLRQVGYKLIYEERDVADGIARWLEAWVRVQAMVTPAIRSIKAFDQTYPGLFPSVSDWVFELSVQLHNAGLKEGCYMERLIVYAHEFLACFPDDSLNEYTGMYFKRDEAEALWHLGRRAESEVCFQALVDQFPDSGWAWIGWADRYSPFPGTPEAYEQAEAILQRALSRPTLHERMHVLDRLLTVYEMWDQPEKIEPYLAEWDALVAAEAHQSKGRKG